jgi:hypothetical protein
MTSPNDSGRLPTLEALERELVARAEQRLGPRRPPGIVVAALVALLVGAMTLTSFGQAIAERIGELIGIGDEPTRERIDPAGEPAVVIGVGDVSGRPFEIVASTDPAFGKDRGHATCFSLDFPGAADPASAGCLTKALRSDVRRHGISATAAVLPRGSLPHTRTLVTGVAGPGAERVLITSTSTSAVFPTTLARLGPGLGRRIGTGVRASFFVAFLPREALAGAETGTGARRGRMGAVFLARAFTASGRELARARFGALHADVSSVSD